MSDISDLSSFDDTMSDPDYGNPNSPIEVSDFLAPARTRKTCTRETHWKDRFTQTSSRALLARRDGAKGGRLPPPGQILT